MDKVKLQVILLVFIAFLFLSITNAVKAKTNLCKCTKEDEEYAKYWGYYKPEEACEFGVKIQKLVKERKLKELFLLVEGELMNGPRKKYIKNKKFSDIFSEEWRLEVLKSDPPCSPVGWRGFMLGNGLIWYNKSEDNKWHIISINDWIEEKFDESDLPVAWKVGDKILPPQCFVRELVSSDYFEAAEFRFSIKNKKDFRKNPGKYLGKEIPLFDIFLVVNLDECLSYKVKLEIIDRTVITKKCNDDGHYAEYCDFRPKQYTILAKVSQKNCKKLAPYIPGRCISSYLLEIGEVNKEGTWHGWDFGYNIYGVFELNNKKKIIVPLKNFEKENDARNFIDTLNQE